MIKVIWYFIYVHSQSEQKLFLRKIGTLKFATGILSTIAYPES